MYVKELVRLFNMKKILIVSIIVVLGLLLIGTGKITTGYNQMTAAEEQVNAQWSEVANQYKRRADLVPNLVSAVKMAGAHEKDVFIGVAEARAKVGNITVNSNQLNDPQIFERYQKAQGELTTALSRLMVVSERYPELKSLPLFQDLATQLEGTENRIAIARNRYIQSVQNYNTLVRSFPNNIIASYAGFAIKPSFSENEAPSLSPKEEADISVAPKI